MAGSLRRFNSITRLLQKQPNLADPIERIHPFFRNQMQAQTREYFRFPNVVRKVREYEIPPSLFTSPFSSSSSSSSSSSTASFGKVGFVGWYLGMVKSWPVLTKSVTSSAIYIAADLSSQPLSSIDSPTGVGLKTGVWQKLDFPTFEAKTGFRTAILCAWHGSALLLRPFWKHSRTKPK